MIVDFRSELSEVVTLEAFFHIDHDDLFMMK